MKDARAGDDQTRRLYLAKGLSVPSPLQPSRQRRFFSSCITKLDKLILRGGGGGGGVLPYIGYTGMCH